MKSLVAVLAALSLASPTLAAALLNDPTIQNQIHHGGQTRARMVAWRVAHPIAFDPRDVLPASAGGGARHCPAPHGAATFAPFPAGTPTSFIAG